MKLFKFSKEEKEQIKVLLFGFTSMVIMCALIFLAAIISSCTSHANANIPEKEIVCEHSKIINAYNNLLHVVWVDNPDYVEDVLTETDEFYELDRLLNGDWGDVFELKDSQDSLIYSITKSESNIPKFSKNKLYGTSEKLMYLE